MTLEELEKRVTILEPRLTNLESKLTSLDSRLTTLESKKPISAQIPWSKLWAILKAILPYILVAGITYGATQFKGCSLPINVNPIKVQGLHVLISYDKNVITPDQQGIIYGTTVRSYLDQKCALGQDQKTPERRIYPISTDVSGEAQWIRDVMSLHKDNKPFMFITNGRTTFDGPIPTNVDEALKLLKQYGG